MSGNFSMPSRCDGPLMISSLHDLCRVWLWKKNENRPTFSEVMGN